MCVNRTQNLPKSPLQPILYETPLTFVAIFHNKIRTVHIISQLEFQGTPNSP